MWFYPLLLFLAVLAILGGVLAGGIFTIVLVPLAVIALTSAIVYAMWGKALQDSSGVSTDASWVSDRPLPWAQQTSDGPARSSPEELVEAWRERQ